MVKEKKSEKSAWTGKIQAYTLKNAISHEGKAVESSVISGLFAEGLKKEQVKEVIEEVKKTVSKINKMSLEKQQSEFSILELNVSHRPEREGLPELPNAGKGVRMRFAPSPSGPLHIGHMISNMSSSLYVKKYGGNFFVRIEDTNPEKIDSKAYDGIKKDCDWLFGNVSEYIIQSDRIPIYYKYAEELIKKEAAYVCVCDNEKFKELVKKSKACPCRNLSIKENLERWKKMLDSKGYKEGQAALRFKSDLKDPNPALRDFPIARISLEKHPRQKNKYRVWPLMNLSVPIDDIEYKMTHIIRGKDHKDNAERQKRIYKILGKEEQLPWINFIGRVKFTDMAMSKRKITAAIQEGEFDGWEDIRLPTIAALRKRGFQPKAFEELAIQRGLSEVDKVISKSDFFEIINNFNRKFLHEIAIKADFVVSGKGDLILVMDDASEIKIKSKIAPKPNEIYHFVGLGYCRYDKDKKFYFTHK
ncbi:MAG: glutamate--tRNA ligase family protein [Nanoarchaeota archaeon]